MSHLDMSCGHVGQLCKVFHLARGPLLHDLVKLSEVHRQNEAGQLADVLIVADHPQHGHVSAHVHLVVEYTV